MTMLSRRSFGALALGALAAPNPFKPGAFAQAYPTRPITLVVSWAPGGSTDFVTRVLAQKMTAELGQQVLVDNRPGASGTIGHGSVARARPDGYTLLMGVNSTYAMARHLFPQRGYDDEKAFAGIGRVASTPIFLCINPKLPATTLPAFVTLAKANKGKFSYASSGAGSSAHLATELFLRMAEIEVQNITYRGGAPAVQALITGEVEMAFVDAVTALPLMAGGQIRALGVSSAARISLARDIPTIAEQGFAGYEAASHFALLAPAATPEPIIRRLHTAMSASMAAPDVIEKLTANAIFPEVGTPEAWPAYLQAETARWGEVIRTRGIVLE